MAQIPKRHNKTSSRHVPKTPDEVGNYTKRVKNAESNGTTAITSPESNSDSTTAVEVSVTGFDIPGGTNERHRVPTYQSPQNQKQNVWVILGVITSLVMLIITMSYAMYWGGGINSKVNILDTNITTQNSDIKTISSDISDMKQKISGLAARLDTATSSSGDIPTLKTELSLIRKDMTTILQRASAYQESIKALEKQIDNLDRRLKSPQ